MEEQSTLSIIIILVSGALFIYPLFLFFKVKKISDEHDLSKQWVGIIIYILFFAIAYGMLTYAMITNQNSLEMHVESLIFVSGSIFVALISWIYVKIIEGLELKVKDRTRKLEQTHKKNIRKEKELRKLKDHFIFVAAHELRTPVTAIKWSLELILDKTEKQKTYTKVDKENLLIIEENANHLKNLVNDLLDASRIESGTFKIVKQKFDFHTLLNETVKQLSPIAKRSSTTIKLQPPEKPLPQIYGDRRRTKEIITNLISNAIKFNRPKGKVNISWKRDGNNFIVEVRDTGIGIRKTDIKKLFKKFSRLDIKKDIESTGLGLYITKTIVEKLNGEIWIKSGGINKGSTFSFTLPIK